MAGTKSLKVLDWTSKWEQASTQGKWSQAHRTQQHKGYPKVRKQVRGTSTRASRLLIAFANIKGAQLYQQLLRLEQQNGNESLQPWIPKVACSKQYTWES